MIRKPTRLAPGRASSQQKNKSENPWVLLLLLCSALFFLSPATPFSFLLVIRLQPPETSSNSPPLSPPDLFFFYILFLCLPQQVSTCSFLSPVSSLTSLPTRCIPSNLAASISLIPGVVRRRKKHKISSSP